MDFLRNAGECRLGGAGEPPEQPPGLLISLEALDTDAAGLTAQRHFDVFGGGQAQRDAARERFRWHQRQGVQPESVQV